MLLSFERPAKPVISRRPSGPAWSPAPPTLFADLENYTVANELWVSPGGAARLFPKITVKIVRAHGGCLGTKSR